MSDWAVIAFWLSLASLVYVYGGFPILVMIVGQLRKRPLTPTMSLIIAAYNKEEAIAERLDNARGVDYPRESSSKGEGLYWRYDTWLKRRAGQTGSVVSAHRGPVRPATGPLPSAPRLGRDRRLLHLHVRGRSRAAAASPIAAGSVCQRRRAGRSAQVQPPGAD